MAWHQNMAADLRSRMAVQQVTVADLARKLGRSENSVSRYRMGREPIPLQIARKLYDMGLLSAEAIVQSGDAA